MNFRFLGDLDILPVMPMLHKLEPHKWRGEPPPDDGNDFGVPVKTRILRCHRNPTIKNWPEDLPVVDFPEFEKWTSMRRLIDRARAKIAADPVIRSMVDIGAPLARA